MRCRAVPVMTRRVRTSSDSTASVNTGIAVSARARSGGPLATTTAHATGPRTAHTTIIATRQRVSGTGPDTAVSRCGDHRTKPAAARSNGKAAHSPGTTGIRVTPREVGVTVTARME